MLAIITAKYLSPLSLVFSVHRRGEQKQNPNNEEEDEKIHFLLFFK